MRKTRIGEEDDVSYNEDCLLVIPFTMMTHVNNQYKHLYYT